MCLQEKRGFASYSSYAQVTIVTTTLLVFFDKWVCSDAQKKRGENPLPWTWLCAVSQAVTPGCGWPSGLQVHIAQSYWIFHQETPPPPPIFLPRATLDPFSAQPVPVPGIALIQMQDLALGLAGLHEVHTEPPLEPVRVPLGAIPFLQHADSTHSCMLSAKCAEGALRPTIHYTNKDAKQPPPVVRER